MAIVQTRAFGSDGFFRGHFVYFLLCDDGDCVLIKVGISESPLARAKAIATGCPHPLKYVGYCEIGSEGAARDAEGSIHASLGDWRTQGEWFRFPVDEHHLFRKKVYPILASHRARKRSTDPLVQLIDFAEYVKQGREFRRRVVSREVRTSIELQITAAAQRAP